MSRSKKVKCGKCGKQIDTDDQFCGYCGEENQSYDPASKKGTGKTAQRNRLQFRVLITVFIIAIVVAAYYAVFVAKLL